MRLSVIAFKECWKDSSGQWYSLGGFPLQVTALGKAFGELRMLDAEVAPRVGGNPIGGLSHTAMIRKFPGKGFMRKLAVLGRVPFLLRIIGRELRVTDAVYLPLPGNIPLLALLVTAFLRKRAVVRYCGAWESDSQTTIFYRITKALMRRLAGERCAMFTTGAGEGEAAQGISWIYATAITSEDVASIDVDFERPPASPLNFVYNGRLAPEKGLGWLIDVFAKLVKAKGTSSFRLHLIGAGPLREQLERQVIAEGIRDNVQFWGQLNHYELLRALLQMDVAIMPSLSEGYNKALIDGMLCGLPGIATTVGAARATLGEDGQRGWLLAPGDSRALMRTMLRVYEAPIDWPQLRRRCRVYAEQHTLECWADQIKQAAFEVWKMEAPQ